MRWLRLFITSTIASLVLVTGIVTPSTAQASVTKTSKRAVVAKSKKPTPQASIGKQRGLYHPDNIGLESSAAVIVDSDSGDVLFEKNAKEVLPIASITKLMMAMVVLEAKQPLDETISIGTADVDTIKNTSSRLRIGSELTRGQFLNLALMASENRAAHTLCRHYPGGVDACVDAMNAKAKELGMNDTRYFDPTGLSHRNRSSARDLSILLARAAKNEIISAYSTASELAVELDGKTLMYRTTDNLVRKPDWSIKAQKTGYIAEAGFCLALHAKVIGRNITMVFLDSKSGKSRIADAERARNWILRHYYSAKLTQNTTE